MKQKQILMTKHMLCLCCVVMTLLNDGDTEQRAQAIQCALSFEALSRRTTKLTKILSAKINKTKRKALDVDDVVTVAFNFNSTQ